MADIDYLAHIRDESARFAAALADVDPASRVPTCPDWNAADLLWHLGEVQVFWATVIRERLTDTEGYSEPPRPTDYAELLTFFARATDDLIAALERADDDVAVWTWWPTDQTVGFIRRRQAHEALIHRLDAELVSGAISPLDAALATDGIDHAVHVDLCWVPEWADRTAGSAVGRLHATDVDRSWLVSVSGWGGTSPNTGKTWDERTITLVTDGEPSYTIAAPAGLLEAWLWNREPASSIAVTGDLDAFAQFQAVVAASGD